MLVSETYISPEGQLMAWPDQKWASITSFDLSMGDSVGLGRKS